jgi:hypothetical protein
MQKQLGDNATRAVLDYLEVERTAPDLALMNRLIDAYGRHVPWESASRIARRARTAETTNCPRWPHTFWDQAQRHGTGGTCFESNLAFAALLRALGFATQLTINDMLETVGCHTAIITQVDGQRWLVDAGYPVLCAVPIDPERTTEARSPYLKYSLTPVAHGRYLVENRPHPKPYMFHLIDHPVDLQSYVRATTNDYGPDGLFLDRVIIRKVVEGDIWRFDGNSRPFHLEQFRDGERTDHALPADPVAAVSAHFGIDAAIVGQALALVEQRAL